MGSTIVRIAKIAMPAFMAGVASTLAVVKSSQIADKLPKVSVSVKIEKKTAK